MSFKKPTANQFSLFLLRLIMGYYFAVAGFRKVSGEISNGLGSFFRGEGFQNRQPDFIPDLLMAPYGYALPWAELIFGITLLLGLFHRVSAWAIQIMLVTIGIALLFSGELLPLHHVLVLIPAVLILQLQGPGALALDSTLKKEIRSPLSSDTIPCQQIRVRPLNFDPRIFLQIYLLQLFTL